MCSSIKYNYIEDNYVNDIYIIKRVILAPNFYSKNIFYVVLFLVFFTFTKGEPISLNNVLSIYTIPFSYALMSPMIFELFTTFFKLMSNYGM